MTNDTAASGRAALAGAAPSPADGAAPTNDLSPEPRASADRSPELGGASSSHSASVTRPAPDLPSAPDDSSPTDPPSAPDVAGPGLGRAGVLAALALAWLAAMLWVTHASISSDVGAVALATAASTLPPVVSAALVAGAAAGLLATTLIPRGNAGRAAVRSGVAAAAGAGTGLVAGVLFVAGSGTDPARMAVAGTLAAAATVGGAIAGVRAGRIVAAVVAASLAVFATGVVLGFFKPQLLDFYGAGDDPASLQSAVGWFAATAAVASGLVAGLTAYRMLGGARRDPTLRWPAYLVAGAGSGLLLLVAEAIVRTGGAKVFRLVREISEDDRTWQAWGEGSRVNNALVVLFVGAIVAIIALGRTLGPRPEPVDEDDR
jgi:hypothetical protein